MPLFVVAEIGLNHGGSPDEALRLVDAAARSGASAVKLQTLHADGLVAGHCPAPAHVVADSLRDFFRQFELDEAAHRRIAGHARAAGLAVMSTPFDEGAVDLLERIGVDAYKVASGDLTHVGLIRRIAVTGKPMVLSSGMSTLAEVLAAVDEARHAGASEIGVLHCVSSYPVPVGSENLAAIRTLAHALELPVGLSDHGATGESIVVAVAMGASIYERHLIAETGSDAIDAAVSSNARAACDGHRRRRACTCRHGRRAEDLSSGRGCEPACQPARSLRTAVTRRRAHGAAGRRDRAPSGRWHRGRCDRSGDWRHGQTVRRRGIGPDLGGARCPLTCSSRQHRAVSRWSRPSSARLAASGGGRVIVTDINPLSPAVHVADRAYLVPLSDAPDYLDEIAEICTLERVSLVIPTIDDELERFAKARDAFSTQGIRVAVSSPETCAICDDKLATCEYLRRQSVAAAQSWRAGQVPSDVAFPLFVKPRVGRGGVGAYRALDAEQLAFFNNYVHDAIVQEFLDGPEFTIDMLCDFDGRVLSVVPRERVVIRAGVIDRGRTSADRRLIDIAVETARVLRFVGAVNLQCRVVNGATDDFRNQPAVLRRYSPDHCCRRRLSADPGGSGRRPRGPTLHRHFHAGLLDDELRGFDFPGRRSRERAFQVHAAPAGGCGMSAIDAVIILQARMASSRLPGKALRTIGSRSVVARCLERLLAARTAPLVLATTERAEDDVLVEEASSVGVPAVRGATGDVLARFAMVIDLLQPAMGHSRDGGQPGG
jgi:sialic acid synthase SpsE